PGSLIITAICCAFLPHFAYANRPWSAWQAAPQQVSVGEWFTFLPQRAPFSVTLPAMPTEKTKDIESGIRMRSYDLRTRTSEYCIVWMTGLPESRLRTGSLDFLLPRALDEVLKSARQDGKTDLVTTQKRDIALYGYYGRESVMESAINKIEARGFIVGRDFIGLVVMHPKEEEATGEARRFFECFALSDSVKRAEAGGQADVSAEVPPAIDVDERPVPVNKPRPGYTE